MSDETWHKSSHMHIIVITFMLFSQGFQSMFLLFLSQRGIETRLEPHSTDSASQPTVGDSTLQN